VERFARMVNACALLINQNGAPRVIVAKSMFDAHEAADMLHGEERGTTEGISLLLQKVKLKSWRITLGELDKKKLFLAYYI